MHGERGAALLEVMVSAVVLFIATGATLLVLDGSSRTSAQNRDRLVAANLAEEDQERLRGLSLVTLRADPGQVANPTVNGIEYSITSETRAITDSLGFQPTCTSGTDTRDDYLLLTSTVRRRDGRLNPPVVLRSLLAPKASTTGYRGTLSVPFEDRNGTPLPGVTAAAAGPEDATSTSNASGCAVFRDLEAGTYAVTYDLAGYVSPTGNAGTVSVSGVIVAGQTNFTPTQRYDRAARVNAQVRTVDASGAAVAGSALSVSVTTTDAAGGGTPRVFSVGTAAATIAATDLFPFGDGYAAYTGSCAANDPTGYGQAAQTVTVGPGGTSTVPVFAPTLVLRAPAGQTIARAVLTSADTGCSQTLPVTIATPAASIQVPVPFGRWQVCADNGTFRATRPATADSRSPTVVDFTGAATTTGRCA